MSFPTPPPTATLRTRQPPTTPRKHKEPQKTPSGPKSTPSKPTWSASVINSTLARKLKLSFEPDPWQLFILSKIMEGYDSIILAGTGYGKSLIFEGLAVLGGPGKVVVIICPLKALENDQVESAISKGLKAVTVNEDTPESERKSIWEQIRKTAQLVYISPEMALSQGFQSLWTDSKFRSRLTALVIDEAHCVHEWGSQKFRPDYAKLTRLRTYTGQEVPFVACTATCPTATFESLWESLGYGYRPFWGIDVGCDRPNLFFHTRTFQNPSNPSIDLLNLLPSEISEETQLSDIKKILIYIDSEAACRTIRDQIRRLLPDRLRGCVRAFSSNLSETAKKQCWAQLKAGDVRIVVATDAAGMGCNVDDIDITVILGCPRSFSIVSQRWGRAGRKRGSTGACLLLVPEWAFRPKKPLVNPAITAAQGRGKMDSNESKANAKKRENLAPSLLNFINLATNDCAHRYLRDHFRPCTNPAIYHGLAAESPSTTGSRATESTHVLNWTVLDLNRVPPRERCCDHCNPELATAYQPSDDHDPRRFAFANNFLFPDSTIPSRPNSSASRHSQVSSPSGTKHTVSKDEKASLQTSLVAWREQRHIDHGAQIMFSSQIFLPDKLINRLLEGSHRFLRAPTLCPAHILSIIRWDSASERDLQDVVEVLTQWRDGLNHVQRTPPSQRRPSKRAKLTAPRIARPPLLPRPPNVTQPTSHHDVFGTPPVISHRIVNKPLPTPPSSQSQTRSFSPLSQNLSGTPSHSFNPKYYRLTMLDNVSTPSVPSRRSYYR